MLEDNPVDAELVQKELEKAGLSFMAKVVATRREFLRQLDSFDPDIILSDYALPGFDGISAMRMAVAGRELPDGLRDDGHRDVRAGRGFGRAVGEPGGSSASWAARSGSTNRKSGSRRSSAGVDRRWRTSTECEPRQGGGSAFKFSIPK
jgi:hypothetical protein